MRKPSGPRILLLDIETAPIVAHVWGLWDNNVSLNQIEKDWHLLSWAAKWLDDAPNKVMYMDQRNSKSISDDKKILESMWKLLDEADIVITQNGKNFDHKKLNARFIINGMKPPSSFKYIDTLILAKKHFGFTSNKLEYMSDKLCTKYKKLKHTRFPGHDMWVECLKGNKEAWKEMEKYNKHDVLSLEELYKKLQPWDGAINFDVYHEGQMATCTCGSQDFRKNGFTYSSVGKYQRYACSKCGAERKSRLNLLPKDKIKSIKVGVTR